MEQVWRCTYDKTYNGTCDQQRQVGKETCYYHTKVVAGLIEVDEDNVMLEMPAISLA
jgi:hypothetical protein